MKKIVLSGALLLLMMGATKAQQESNGLWTAENESAIELRGPRQIVPQKYLSFKLQTAEFLSLLAKAQNEKALQIQQSAAIISLPLPNGLIQRFRVVESPVMAPELSAAYPNIKTFSLRGIDDPYANGKLDYTEFGVHAMVMSPEGDFFIDPYCVNNTQDYISYYTVDFKKDAEAILPESGPITETGTGKQKPAPAVPAGTAQKTAAAACVGANLRTYRLAVACTGEYAKAATGLTAPTVAQTLARIVTSVNRVDGVYEKEVAVRLVLVATETNVIFTNPSTDPFNGNNNSVTLINESQTIITNTIGSANFDIGHTFSTGGGGLAFLGCVCNNSNKARGITGSPSPVGDPYDIDYVAHEMGHQFGGNHTFNCGTGSCAGNRNGGTAVEPGSGVTIMAYAGICGNIDNLANNSIAYFHAISYDEIVNFTNSGSGNGCAVTTTTGNQPPVVTGSNNYVVPVSTPFYLSGNALDPDGDPVTYSWEQTDAGISTASWNSGSKPFFRSYVPVTTGVRFFPNFTVVNSGNYTGTRGEYLPTTPQNLSFRLTARDNKMGGGGVCNAINSVVVDASGPLLVTNPTTLGIVWGVGTQQTITWDVNGTNFAPVSCDSVRIYISYNNGNTYNVFLNSTENDGFQQITVPTLSATISTCRIKVESIGNIFYDISNNNFTISTDVQSDVGLSSFSINNPLGLQVWPNPANDKVSFSMANLQSGQSTDVKILDLLGRVVSEKNYQGKTQVKDALEIQALKPGIYFIQVSNAGNQAVYRFIKE